MYKARYMRSTLGLSAIEQACWDILGKSLGAPCWQLFGGKHWDKLRVYANGWYQGPRDPVFFAEKAAEMVSRGYTALKFDPSATLISRSAWRASGWRCASCAPCARPWGLTWTCSLKLTSGSPSLPLCAWRGSWKSFRPFWIETPVRMHDLEGTFEVARSIRFPVATGEGMHELREFADLLAPRIVDIVQPEPMALGPSQSRKVFAIAQTYEALLACHQAQSPFCTAMNAHHHAPFPTFSFKRT